MVWCIYTLNIEIYRSLQKRPIHVNRDLQKKPKCTVRHLQRLGEPYLKPVEQTLYSATVPIKKRNLNALYDTYKRDLLVRVYVETYRNLQKKKNMARRTYASVMSRR